MAAVEDVDVADELGRLAAYVQLRLDRAVELDGAHGAFTGEPLGRRPFVVGVVGPVAVGKSTFAAALRDRLASDGATDVADVVTTDSFLLPNDELVRRGLLERKGFPDSYDWPALTSFLGALRAGEPDVVAPVYSHEAYDVLPGAVQRVGRPDVVVVEGLNLLQHPPGGGPCPPDLLDLSIYVHADDELLRAWFVHRFMALRAEAETDPTSFFAMFASMGEADALAAAGAVWEGINAPNVRDHIAPTRARAHVVVEKGPDHEIVEIRIGRP